MLDLRRGMDDLANVCMTLVIFIGFIRVGWVWFRQCDSAHVFSPESFVMKDVEQLTAGPFVTSPESMTDDF
jgi:D-alanyl-lipoteichoic acid acyltransferase DltB (MBOAT superfamily)